MVLSIKKQLYFVFTLLGFLSSEIPKKKKEKKRRGGGERTGEGGVWIEILAIFKE